MFRSSFRSFLPFFLIARQSLSQEAVAVMVLAFVPSFVPMIFLRAMSGFFMASLRPVCNALVADARPYGEVKERYVAIFAVV